MVQTPQPKLVTGKRWGTKKEKKPAAGRLVSEGSNCCATNSTHDGNYAFLFLVLFLQLNEILNAQAILIFLSTNDDMEVLRVQ